MTNMRNSLILQVLFSSGFVLIGLPSIPSVAAQSDLLDKLDESLKLIRENTRTTERFTEFVNACTSLVTSGDLSFLSTCDSVTQKYNIEMGKFHKENQLGIEDLVYPYTIPSHAQSAMNLDSSQVIGSTEPEELLEHIDILSGYNDILQKVLHECGSAGRQYDYQQVGKCIDITKSLNEKNRNFNTNAGAEINKVLAQDTSNRETGGADFEFP